MCRTEIGICFHDKYYIHAASRREYRENPNGNTHKIVNTCAECGRDIRHLNLIRRHEYDPV